MLRRVSGLSRAVAGIGSRRDLSARVGAYGRDELGALAESIDAMLAELQQAAETHRALTDAIPDLILRVDESGRLLDANRPEDPCWSRQGTGTAGCLPPSPSAACRSCASAISSRRMRIFEHRQETAGGARDYEARVLAIAPGRRWRSSAT